MTAVREAVILPAIFLTVVLLGGLSVATDTTRLVPPSVFSLVLGVLLVRVIVQSGAVAPERLLASTRTGLENTSGFIVLVTLWVASAQTIAMLIPASGLPRLAFSVFFFVLLLNTAAAAPDRVRLLRSLGVTFGAAFVLKFVVLHGLSAPGGGRLQRVMQTLVDGVTLGVLMQEPQHPLAAYVALAVVILCLLGVFLLPARADERLVRTR